MLTSSFNVKSASPYFAFKSFNVSIFLAVAATLYPFSKNQFDVIFCRNVLIYFSVEDQNEILKKLFKHLKIGGTLYLGHSENPQDLVNYVKRVGQNIFLKEKEIL